MNPPNQISQYPINLNRILLYLLPLAALAGFLMWSALPVYAHGESLIVTPVEAKPGEPVNITGEEFPPGEEVELSLESVRGRISIGHVETDAEEGFSMDWTIPADTPAGTYQLIAATGDDNVTVDFTILEGDVVSRSGGSGELVFERSTGEAIVIGLVAVALAVSGTVLVLVKTRQRA